MFQEGNKYFESIFNVEYITIQINIQGRNVQKDL